MMVARTLALVENAFFSWDCLEFGSFARKGLHLVMGFDPGACTMSHAQETPEMQSFVDGRLFQRVRARGGRVFFATIYTKMRMESSRQWRS